MSMLEHSAYWYKGEIFEATIIAIAGSLLLVVSLIFWKFGKTPNAQAIVIPLTAVGLLLTLTGVFMASSNAKKLKIITASKIENQKNFIQSEKQRVENFQPLYTYTKISAGICFTLAIVLFFVSENRYWQAIAIGLILIGGSGLTIDYFSKERANIYYNLLLKQIE